MTELSNQIKVKHGLLLADMKPVKLYCMKPVKLYCVETGF
jgi:hypothetical protein